jgi:catechol 2,3-dioxygenase-like lactoylglutathione lyase family enzyme
MDIQFIASIAVITPDPQKSRELFIDALGLPLEAGPGSDYFHSERVEGSKHFGVWPLSEAGVRSRGAKRWLVFNRKKARSSGSRSRPRSTTD